MSDYIPISCYFYDELEASAVKHERSIIVYEDESEEKSIEDFIVDFRTKNKEEFVILKSGQEIRMDRILSLNGKKPKNYC